MEAGLRSLVVRERDGLHSNPQCLEKGAKLLESFRIRPKTLTDRQEIVCDPEEIASLGGGRGTQRPEDGHAVSIKAFRDRHLFTAPKLLAHPEADRAPTHTNHRLADT